MFKWTPPPTSNCTLVYCIDIVRRCGRLNISMSFSFVRTSVDPANILLSFLHLVIPVFGEVVNIVLPRGRSLAIKAQEFRVNYVFTDPFSENILHAKTSDGHTPYIYMCHLLRVTCPGYIEFKPALQDEMYAQYIVVVELLYVRIPDRDNNFATCPNIHSERLHSGIRRFHPRLSGRSIGKRVV